MFPADAYEIRRLNVTNGAGALSMLGKLAGTEKAVLYAWWWGKQHLKSVRSHDPAKSAVEEE
jgi:hypothetical protein